MQIEEALSIIQKYYPCPHENVDTNLGNGKIWCKCEDCGETLHQDNLPRYRKSYKDFEEAVYTIQEQIKDYRWKDYEDLRINGSIYGESDAFNCVRELKESK